MTFRARERRRVKTPVGVESKTQQHMRDQCDVNQIMARYQKTGLIEHVSRYQGNYGEFADAPSYHEGLNKMLAAEAMFMTLPSTVREAFSNDPGEFLEFALDPSNEDGMRELGLLPKMEPVSPPPAPKEEAAAKPANSEAAASSAPSGAKSGTVST